MRICGNVLYHCHSFTPNNELFMGIKLLFGPHNCIYCINPLLEVIPATMKQRELIFKDNWPQRFYLTTQC